VAQHEDGPLTAVQPIDGRGDRRAAFAREQPVLGVGGRPGGGDGLVRAGDFGADEPAIAAAPRLAPIQAAVDENAGEPDLARPRLAVGGDVREHLDERVLDDLVGIGGVPEILVGDARRAALVDLDERAEALAGLIHVAALDEAADLDRDPRILRQRGGRPPRRSARQGEAVPGVRQVEAGRVERVSVVRSAGVTIHRGIRCGSGVCLQLTASGANC
jgi:hypothetical protein